MAHWIKHDYLFDPIDYECSACGEKADGAYSVCPHCGADMGGDETYKPDFVDECEVLDMFFGH